jgi:hypothetical protein
MPERSVMAERAELIEDSHKLPARKWLRMLRGLPAASAATSATPATSTEAHAE